MPITLRLLGGEPETFTAGVVIVAFRVIDGANRVVAGSNSKADAERIKARFAERFPDKNFYVI